MGWRGRRLRSRRYFTLSRRVLTARVWSEEDSGPGGFGHDSLRSSKRWGYRFPPPFLTRIRFTRFEEAGTMEAFVGLGIFLAILGLIEGTYLVARNRLNPEAKQVRQRLKVLSLTDYSGEEVAPVRKKRLSGGPWFNRLLLSFR